MPKHKVENIRNLAVISHRGAGKTSLVEALLFCAGSIEKLGSVDSGNTVCDFDPEEIKRKTTIFPSLCFLEHQGCKVNLIDTPGFADFSADVMGSLHVVEGAILVIDAVAGVEVQTERVWSFAAERNLPVAIFVNKIDKENAQFEAVVNSIKEQLSPNLIPFSLPIGEREQFGGVVDIISGKAFVSASRGAVREEIPSEMVAQGEESKEQLIEAAAEATDELTEKYLDEGTLSNEEIAEGLRLGIKSRSFFPLFVGSATSNVGPSLLLDALVNYFPSPTQALPVTAKTVATGEEVAVTPDSEAPCRALVFRTIVDPYVGRLSLLRVFSGALVPDLQMTLSSNGARERISQPLLINGRNQHPVEAIAAGDLGAVTKLSEARTYDSLCTDEPVELPRPFITDPVFSLAVQPETRADEEKLTTALARIAEEDVSFAYRRDYETGEIVISGGGQLHLDIVVARLQDKYNVNVTVGSPKIAYRETITQTAEAQGRYKKQTGGRGQYGDVFLRLEPLPRGAGFEFDQEIRGGEVPSQYFPSVQKGIQEALQTGVLASYPVVDFKAILFKGSFHPVDSSDIAFKIAASMAFKSAMSQAKPILLEPMVEIEVTVPEENMGDVIGDLNSKRARISGMEARANNQVIKALAPLAEIATFSIDLKSMTQGRGSFTARFSHYEPLPPHISEMIQQRRQEVKEET